MEHFTQLSLNERVQIYNALCAKQSQGDIAKMLGRDKSTISREIRRNSDSIGYLYPRDAHQAAKDRRHKYAKKLTKYPKLQAYVVEKLYQKWSPDAISGRLKLERKKLNNKTISKEAIYQWIYSSDGEKLGLKGFLVRANKKRGLKRRTIRSKIRNRVSVHDRPKDIDLRGEIGHYECDLVFNSGSQSQNVCTLIERTTRQVTVIKNENKTSKTVIGALIDYFDAKKPAIKSITFDNGSEFAEHEQFHARGIATYFCDPGAPWQKGSIEHLNGMLRRFIPFSRPVHEVTNAVANELTFKMNNMPRAILGYRTPLEVSNGFANPLGKRQGSRVKSAWPAAEARKNVFN